MLGVGSYTFDNGVAHTESTACAAFEPEGPLPRGPFNNAQSLQTHSMAFHGPSNSLAICHPQLVPATDIARKCYFLDLTQLGNGWIETEEVSYTSFWTASGGAVAFKNKVKQAIWRIVGQGCK